jgi:hypothetical protein
VRRAVVVALCGLLALLGASLSVADAAVVPLRPGTLTAFVTSDRCTSETLEVRPGASLFGVSREIVLPAVPAACLGRPYSVRVFNDLLPLSWSDATGTLPASGSRVVIPVPLYEVRAVDGVAMTISTWGVRTAWS